MNAVIKLKNDQVVARIVKENARTVWVELPDGNVVNRHKRKHVIGVQLG